MRFPISKEQISKRLEEIAELGLNKGFDLSPLHIAITDDNANIIYVNKAVLERTGFSMEEAIGKNPADLWGGKMPKEFYEKMWHTIKVEKKPFSGDVQNIRKDGTSYWQELLITPILDENGNVKFFVAIEPDITDKKKREQFKEQFISAIGHQVRNPLNAIRWILNNLLASSKFGESERRELEKIYQENLNLTNLISDLLILSRIENPVQKKEIIRLDEELENMVETVRKKHPNVLIIFGNEAGPVKINAIKSLSLQVFLNILYNSAEHADKKDGKVAIKLQKYENDILFSCHNNGEPIPEEMKPHIFTKVTSTAGGAGLGLFIVKMICDYFGWQVWFDTGESGTTFYLKIPSLNQ